MKGGGKILLIMVICVVVLVWITIISVPKHQDHPTLNQIRFNFSKIDPAYGNIPLKEGYSSYTENKNSITLCLSHDGEYYNMNTLMYVSIHELAHIVTKGYGHTEEFHKNFSDLLQKATAAGVYDPSKPLPVKYCGVSN